MYPRYDVPPEIRLQSSEIFDLLTKLVDKSLVQVSDLGGGRYTMLQTVQDFSKIHLSDSERSRVCDRHFDYYLGLAERSRSEPESSRDVDNFRSALCWYETVDMAGEAHRLDSYIFKFWNLHGHLPDRMEAIAGRNDGGTDSIASNFRRGAASMALRRSDFDRAKSFALLHLEQCKKSGDRSAEASCLNFLGTIFATDGEAEESLRFYEEALAIYLEVGDSKTACKVTFNIGTSNAILGNIEASKSWLERALDQADRFDNQVIARHCRIALANLAIDCRDFQKAKNLYISVLPAEGLYDSLAILGGLSRIALLQNRRETAAVLASAVEARIPSLSAFTPLFRREHWLEKLVAEIRCDMPDDEIELARAEASDMTIDEAIELGLNSITADTAATH